MKRYVVLLACDPGAWETATDEIRDEYFAAHQAFEHFVDTNGRRVSSAALADAGTATTVRHVEGNVTVTDGPFVESVEQMAGYYDVELADLDSALAAAQLLPSAYAVEIRPTMVIEGYESA